MKLLYGKPAVTCAGALWALLAATSASGEDIELFFSGTVQGGEAAPNILLILDDSISMNGEVLTQVDYDPTVTYDGVCDNTAVYWTTGSSLPDCTTTENYVTYDNFVCEAGREAFNQFNGGTFQDRMVQWDPGDEEWDDIGSGQHERMVECEDDEGVHGDYDSSMTGNYPEDGSSGPWNSNGDDSIWDVSCWGWWCNRPGRNYTTYHGNYIDWANGPGASTENPPTRLEVMQDVAANLINSVNGVNIGVMSFNPLIGAFPGQSEGGVVRHAIRDVSTSRSSLIAAVNALAPERSTPLSETLYEAQQYFRGGQVVYSDDEYEGVQEDPIDLMDQSAMEDGVYKSPIASECQKNHIVLLTDGEPRSDDSADTAINGLSDAEGTPFAELINPENNDGPGVCDGEIYPEGFSASGGHCLDDLAEYMFNGDLSSTEPGQQNVVTHTVGFLVDLDVLEETAERGGGKYYTAHDTGSLTQALTAIVSEVLETQSTFVAPAVSVNAFNQTQNLDDLYFAVFRPSGTAHWPGNLKKYRLLSDGTIVDADDQNAVSASTGFFAEGARSIWTDPPADGPNVEEGGAAFQIPSTRTVYTNIVDGPNEKLLTVTGNRVSSTNKDALDDFLGTTDSSEPTTNEAIDFINGLDPMDVDNDSNTTEPRYQMGDPLHSRPATVIYGPTNEDGVIYFATNDGYLHAIDTQTGVEKWAFVPKEFLGNQAALAVDDSGTEKVYGIDGSIAVQIVADRDGEIEAGEKVYLFFGMRRGGDFYYALDVSNPDDPKILWRLGDTELPGLGQTWATPAPARISIDGATQNAAKTVLVLGGGYDTNQDGSATPDDEGNAIYIVDAETGALLWHAGKSGADLNFDGVADGRDTMDYSIPGSVKVVDLNADGFADRLYAADMGGQIWRFDVFNGEARADLITGGVIANLGHAGQADPAPADVRRFYNTPNTAFVSNDQQTFMNIAIGSGYRSHPNDTDNNDRFYSLRDYQAFKWLTQDEFDALAPITDTDLDGTDVTDSLSTPVPIGSKGWKLELRDGATWRGEKALSTALTFNGELFFNTFIPETGVSDGCEPSLGLTRQYRVKLLDGSPVAHLDGVVDGDGDGNEDALTTSDRYYESSGASILSEPTALFIQDNTGDGSQSDDDDSDDGEDDGNGTVSVRVLLCSQTDCSDLDFDASPRRTFWTQDSVE